MMQVIELAPTDEAPALRPGRVTAPVDPAERARHAPDVHLVLADASGGLKGRASVWWASAPSLPAEQVGVVGHYAAEDADAGRDLLERACRRLRDAGCTLAVGPMDGNTWRRYRFIVERGSEPPFFLEPDNPDEWPEHFRAAGFDTLARYTSAVADDIGQRDPRLDRLRARVQEAGVTIRTLNLADADADLARIHALSLESFADNFLYTPLPRDEFMEQNRRLLPFLQPDLVLLAERGPDLAGFLFAVPDVLEQARLGRVRTMIVKTVAVARAIGGLGLGGLLVASAQQNGARHGLVRAIHALMHEQNVSQAISRRYARTIRRYALFARPLG